MITLNPALANRFFDEVIQTFPSTESVDSVVVTHLLSDRPFFLDAVNRIAPIKMLLPKPKSVDQTVQSLLKHRYSFESLSRDDLARNPEGFMDLLRTRCADRPLVLLDIGGYFAPLVTDPNCVAATPQILGVVEDTENGVQRYESAANLMPLDCPVVSVARSPLKNPEDHLVGQSIVFSAEALMRQRGDVILGRSACVIGYGKLGRSIAQSLHASHVRVTVFDMDSLKRVEALSHGFPAANSLSEALRDADFVFCATGKCAIRAEDFPHLKNGAYVASVTSPDDELDLEGIRQSYKYHHETDYVTRHKSGNHEFFLLNRGQAVNFLHGSVVGPFIYLVQAEIIASLSQIASGRVANGLHENSQDLRRKVAELWCNCYAAR